MTRELHSVSQSADFLIASADQAIEVAKKQLVCYRAVGKTITRKSIAPTASFNTLEYIFSSLECERRWLYSYKSRKETAMNLVFNLVTQNDNATTVDISYAMKKDSSSMNTIAILTMVFLPGTAIAVSRASFLSGRICSQEMLTKLVRRRF